MKRKPRYNPVAKYAEKFNKPATHRDKTKYSRKDSKHELHRTDYERID